MCTLVFAATENKNHKSHDNHWHHRHVIITKKYSQTMCPLLTLGENQNIVMITVLYFAYIKNISLHLHIFPAQLQNSQN